MGIDFSTTVYLPNFTVFARQVTITPKVSQPGAGPYSARGIYDTEEIDVAAEDGSVVTDHRTILDIREVDFLVLPQQGDEVFIPPDTGAMGALGDHEVINVFHNGGGETTLQLRKIETAG
jgi:hypothetical protein